MATFNEAGGSGGTTSAQAPIFESLQCLDGEAIDLESRVLEMLDHLESVMRADAPSDSSAKKGESEPQLISGINSRIINTSDKLRTMRRRLENALSRLDI